MEFPPFTIRSKMSNYFRDNKLITFILMKNILFIKKSEVLFDKLKDQILIKINVQINSIETNTDYVKNSLDLAD